MTTGGESHGDSRMTPEEFRDARERLGLSVNKMATALSVEPRSVWRWQSGDQAVPGTVAALLKLMLSQHAVHGSGQDAKRNGLT